MKNHSPDFPKGRTFILRWSTPRVFDKSSSFTLWCWTLCRRV